MFLLVSIPCFAFQTTPERSVTKMEGGYMFDTVDDIGNRVRRKTAEHGGYFYVGEASAGLQQNERGWRIYRFKHTTFDSVTYIGYVSFANGSARFDKIWDNANDEIYYLYQYENN